MPFEEDNLATADPLVNMFKKSFDYLEVSLKHILLVPGVNSKLIDQSIKSFSSKGRGFGAPSVIEKLNIPTSDSKNKIFVKLVDIKKL